MSDFFKKIALAPHDELRTQLGFLLAQNSSPHERQRLFQATQKVFHFISPLNQTDRETGDDGERTQPKGQNIDPIQTEQAVSRVKLIRQSFDGFVCDAKSQVEGLSDPNDTEKFIFTKMSDPTGGTGAIESNGHQLISQLNRVGQSQQRGSLYYAMTAVKFIRWFESTIQQSPQTQNAEAELRRKLLQPPSRTGLRQRRLALTRYLMQGRKWNKLVQRFGYGILLMQPM